MILMEEIQSLTDPQIRRCAAQGPMPRQAGVPQAIITDHLRRAMHPQTEADMRVSHRATVSRRDVLREIIVSRRDGPMAAADLQG